MGELEDKVGRRVERGTEERCWECHGDTNGRICSQFSDRLVVF